MGVYESLVRPILFLQDPEKIHNRFVMMGRVFGSTLLLSWPLGLMYCFKHPSLQQIVLGIPFRNPIGLAAGFDKDCHLMNSLPSMGFGYEEVGSITAEPHPGNPGTRLVRLPKDKGIIVFYGLKNEGAKVLRKRLNKGFRFPVGVSVAKTNKDHGSIKKKLDDWIKGIKTMKNSGDYITLNLSCPNMFDTANFCEPKLLERLLARIKREKITFDKPVLLKLSHDINEKRLDEIIRLCDRYRFVKGFILTNLGKDRSKLKLKSPKKLYEPFRGGISGEVVRPKALKLVRYAYRKAGDRYVIVGCGGIYTAEHAYQYIRNGATLLQLITGMIYGGPGTIRKINKGLVRLLERDGFRSISEAIGVDA